MTQTPAYHVAEFNWGTLKHDWGSPKIAEFELALNRVNTLATRSPGFVWRMGDDAMETAQAGHLSALAPAERLASTLSVWETADQLYAFVHKTVHGAFVRKGASWFAKHTGHAYVLWPVEVGKMPTTEEAHERLRILDRYGPSKEAFDFGWVRQDAARSRNSERPEP